MHFLGAKFPGVKMQECMEIERSYDKVSANVMISVQKMGESESGQIVF